MENLEPRVQTVSRGHRAVPGWLRLLVVSIFRARVGRANKVNMAPGGEEEEEEAPKAASRRLLILLPVIPFTIPLAQAEEVAVVVRVAKAVEVGMEVPAEGGASACLCTIME